jgi:hypothetical protein
VPYNAIMLGDHLLLRPTVIGGDTVPDDYQVIWNGMPIGRILKQPGVPLGRLNWFWGVAFPGRPQPSGHRGQRPRGVQAAVQGSLARDWGRPVRGRYRGGAGYPGCRRSADHELSAPLTREDFKQSGHRLLADFLRRG